MATTPEGRLKRRVKEYIKSAGAPLYDTWYYMPVQNGMGVVGIPDFIGCYRGRFFAIETKAPAQKPRTDEGLWQKATPNQQNRITEIRQAGGAAIITDDMERVLDLFAWLDYVVDGGETDDEA